MRYTLIVAAPITLRFEVEADSLDAAIEQARESSVRGLCHSCAEARTGQWNTTGELDCEPASCELVNAYWGEESVLDEAKEKWE